MASTPQPPRYLADTKNTDAGEDRKARNHTRVMAGVYKGERRKATTNPREDACCRRHGMSAIPADDIDYGVHIAQVDL